MLIDKDDAIKAVCEACYMYKYIGEHYKECKYYPCDDVTALEAVPEAPSGDMISRADAIEELKGSFYFNSEDCRTAIGCIKALPSADAVSMEEHVKELNDLASAWKNKFVNAEKRTEELYDETMRKVANECKTCKERLQNLRPSAEAVQGWIPVEEQPPLFPCLVCDANGNQPSVPLGIVTITDEEHGEWHIDGRLWDTKVFFKGEWCSQTGYGNRIIAWMPLPKPYKGGDSE